MNLRDFTNDLLHNMIVRDFAETKNITLEEAKSTISAMSFREYLSLSEAATAITPPSGNTIGPSTGTSGTQTGAAPTNVKSIWPGKGAPVEMGMTVGLKGANGLPIPGQVSQVDASAKGVKVKNPTTGQDEWVNMDALQPYMAGGKPNPNGPTGTGAAAQPGTNQQSVTTTAEDANDLVRLRELAGIKENCSAGATGAGSIAVAPAAMGTMRKRQATEEEVKKEYTRTEPAKTIVGDTKPAQASGELSANLAARGKKAAGRINNGFKR